MSDVTYKVEIKVGPQSGDPARIAKLVAAKLEEMGRLQRTTLPLFFAKPKPWYVRLWNWIA